MVLLIGAALAVLSIAILAYPFLRARLRPQAEDSVGDASGDAPGLESIYQEIRTLRLEYQLGKVPEDVYQELLRGYRLQAAVVLRDQTQAGAPVLANDPLEQDTGVASVAPPCNRGDGLPARCPNRGAAVAEEDGACPACTASQAGSEGNAP